MKLEVKLQVHFDRYQTTYLALCVVLFLATVLPRAVNNPLWGDEFRTWRDSVGVPWTTLLAWQHNRDHAPLSHMLAKASCLIFHTDAPWALRLPSILAGGGCVLIAFFVGRLLISTLAGLMMALMLAVDFNITVQSQTARMYSLLLLFVLGSIHAFIHVFREPNQPDSFPKSRFQFTPRPAAIALCLLLALGLWTHYAMLGVMSAMLIIGLKYCRKQAGRVVIACVLGASVLAAPGFVKLIEMADRKPLAASNNHATGNQFGVSIDRLAGQRWIAVALVLGASTGLALLALRKKDTTRSIDSPKLRSPESRSPDTRSPDTRAVAVMLAMLCIIGAGNVLLAGVYRPVEGPRYLTVVQPAIWIGLVSLNFYILTRKNILLTFAVVGLFFLGCGYQFSRVIQYKHHPWAWQFQEAMQSTLPAMGFEPGEAIDFIPGELNIYRQYYDKSAEQSAPSRLIPSRFIILQVSKRTTASQLERASSLMNDPTFNPPLVGITTWVGRKGESFRRVGVKADILNKPD